MIIIDEKLHIDKNYTFEEFKTTNYYLNREKGPSERLIILGGIGSRHTINGLSGEYGITLVFQEKIQRVSLSKIVAESFEEEQKLGINNKEICEEVMKELNKIDIDALDISICGDYHYENSESIIITYNEYNPNFCIEDK